MTRVRGSRRVLTVVVAGALVLFGATTALVAAGAAESSGASVLGPGPVTVTLTVDHSRFEPEVVRVRPHTEVRFVIVNRDPIGHEFIVGGPEVHDAHRDGQEARHAPKPGEVSVDALSRAHTTFMFHEPGRVEYACHLPGHYAYGMRGVVVVENDESD